MGECGCLCVSKWGIGVYVCEEKFVCVGEGGGGRGSVCESVYVWVNLCLCFIRVHLICKKCRVVIC